MDLFKFGMEQMNNGTLNNMLEQVGVDDVGSFVNQFRNQAATSSRSGGAAASSGGGSLLDQVNICYSLTIITNTCLVRWRRKFWRYDSRSDECLQDVLRWTRWWWWWWEFSG